METEGESKPDSGSRQPAEHVKKQEQPQTHEDRKAQKLAERIEKKGRKQRKNRSAKIPAKPGGNRTLQANAGARAHEP
jgi:hypothetical protein